MENINLAIVAEDIALRVYSVIKPGVNPILFDSEENVENYTEEFQEVFDTTYDILKIHFEK